MQLVMLLSTVFIALSIQFCAADRKEKIPYYQLFTPMKLIKAASFIYHQHTVTPSKLTFLGAPQTYGRLMRIPLIPSGSTDIDANLVVKMVIGLDKEIGLEESDPSYVISDGQYFIGALIRDKNNYSGHAPCVCIEGSSGTIMENRRNDAILPKPPVTDYPGRLETWLNLSDRWGTCFVPLNGGFSREMVFQHKLNPQNGLFLEIYADDKKEKVGIKYIEVSIVKEN